MTSYSHSEPRRRQRPHPVYWIIGCSLAVIAANMTKSWFGSQPLLLSNQAMAQATTSGGARGVFAFSGQFSKSTYGVYIVDVDAMTIWSYEHLPQKGCLRLASARTWRYDRYLENYNICDLPPEVVEKMVDDQRQYRLQASEQEMP